MSDTNDSFRKEIEEELRRERLTAIWKTYGTYIVAAIAAVLLALASFLFWQSNRQAAAEKAGATYEEAAILAKQGKTEEALKSFEALSADAPSGYVGLAQLQMAGALQKTGKTDEALKSYEQLAASNSADAVIRDYAKLQAAALQVGKVDFTVLKNRLNDLLGENNAYRFTALELLGLAAFQAGNMPEARAAFDKLIADLGTPPGMLQRTRMMLARISEREIAGQSAAKSTPAASDAMTPAKTDAASAAKDTAPDAAEQ